jgi:uncharacterized Zn finger protein
VPPRLERIGAAMSGPPAASRLRELAGPRSYSRGESYFELGAVKRIWREGEVTHGIVVGTQRYRVRLEPGSGGAIAYTCDCPMGQSGAFCKHCVAVGLAIGDAEGEIDAHPAPEALSEIEVRLRSQDHDALVALLVELAEADERTLERLRLRFAADPAAPDLEAVRRAIELACDPPDHVSPYEWGCGIDQALDAIEAIAAGGTAEAAAAAVDLCELIIEGILASRWRFSEADSVPALAIDRAVTIHASAYARAGLDREQLAERLLDLQLGSDEWETFAEPLETHAEALGPSGAARYTELVRERFAELPTLGPGDERGWEEPRYRTTKLMEGIAAASGDPDQLAAVLARDLSFSHQYLRIADAYAEADRHEAAIEWVERGLEQDAGESAARGPDPRLRARLAESCAAVGRHEDALEAAWDRYCDSPSLAHYRDLQPFAERLGRWERWRERAHGVLRERARRLRESAGPLSDLPRRDADHSELVRILLWEGEPDTAWAEAQEGGCEEQLWLELAAAREEEHPADSVTVYKEWIEPTIERKNKASYADAVALIERAGAALERLGRAGELHELIDGVRARHRRKRNLIALMKAAGMRGREGGEG